MQRLEQEDDVERVGRGWDVLRAAEPEPHVRKVVDVEVARVLDLVDLDEQWQLLVDDHF